VTISRASSLVNPSRTIAGTVSSPAACGEKLWNIQLNIFESSILFLLRYIIAYYRHGFRYGCKRISGGDVETAQGSLHLTGLKIDVKQVFLSAFDGDDIVIKATKRIEAGQKLTDEENRETL
jgi:hypothetical protein